MSSFPQIHGRVGQVLKLLRSVPPLTPEAESRGSQRSFFLAALDRTDSPTQISFECLPLRCQGVVTEISQLGLSPSSYSTIRSLLAAPPHRSLSPFQHFDSLVTDLHLCCSFLDSSSGMDNFSLPSPFRRRVPQVVLASALQGFECS